MRMSQVHLHPWIPCRKPCFDHRLATPITRSQSNWKPLDGPESTLLQVLFGVIQVSLEEFGSSLSIQWSPTQSLVLTGHGVSWDINSVNAKVLCCSDWGIKWLNEILIAWKDEKWCTLIDSIILWQLYWYLLRSHQVCTLCAITKIAGGPFYGTGTVSRTYTRFVDLNCGK